MGVGVPKNYVKAYCYWDVAAALNNKAARELLQIIQKKMTPAQVAEGQKQAEILWNKIPK